jgi:hypothetical protein
MCRFVLCRVMEARDCTVRMMGHSFFSTSPFSSQRSGLNVWGSGKDRWVHVERKMAVCDTGV